MIGVPGMTSTRHLAKVEKPRPLKNSTRGDQSNMESVLSEMDFVAQKLNGTTIDTSVFSKIASLCENLKMFGNQLESLYKDQLDRCYVALRNGCRDDHLTLASRYRLLEVIELRAMNWKPNENLINYYKQKLALIEVEEANMEEQQQPVVEVPSSYITTGALLTPPSSITSPVYSNAQYPLYPTQQIIFATQQQQQQQQQQQNTPQQVLAPVVTPPSLGPGELIKNSGKFVKPVRIPGKNYSKDEVVIRNADSGKVMGLKGRRVHMIEELSETIISFQRVAPGARERLVQITGPNDDNINHAKQLIEETIRRNASPVRSEDRDSVFNSLGGSSSSISSHTSDEIIHGTKRVALGPGPMDEALSEYRYTVVHDNESIRITGTNIDLVRTAKIILDEYFNGEQNLNFSSSLSSPESMDTAMSTPRVSTSSPSSCASSYQGTVPGKSPAPNVDVVPPQPSSPQDQNIEDVKTTNNVVTVTRQPLIPSSPKEIVESAENEVSAGNKSSKDRRKLFAKTSEERLSSEEQDGPLTYTRNFLVACSASPVSRLTPANWAQVVRQYPILVKKNSQYLKGLEATMNEKGEIGVNSTQTYLQDCDLVHPKDLKLNQGWSLLRTTSLADEDDNGNS